MTATGGDPGRAVREINHTDRDEVTRVAAMFATDLFFQERPTDEEVEYFSRPSSGPLDHVLGVFEGDELIGAVTMRPATDDPAPREAHIGWLVVAEQRRGEGLGRLLIDEVQRIAVGEGATSMAADAYFGSDPFFEHLGWTIRSIYEGETTFSVSLPPPSEK
jgi:ribosomal protein S18 acetylase RimI-like enzyme